MNDTDPTHIESSKAGVDAWHYGRCFAGAGAAFGLLALVCVWITPTPVVTFAASIMVFITCAVATLCFEKVASVAGITRENQQRR